MKMKKTKSKQNQKKILTSNFFTGLILIQIALVFFLEIGKIQNYITQSSKEKLEKENEVEIKKLQSKLKKLEAQIKESKIKQIKNSATHHITNNFGKMTMKS